MHSIALHHELFLSSVFFFSHQVQVNLGFICLTCFKCFLAKSNLTIVVFSVASDLRLVVQLLYKRLLIADLDSDTQVYFHNHRNKSVIHFSCIFGSFRPFAVAQLASAFISF